MEVVLTNPPLRMDVIAKILILLKREFEIGERSCSHEVNSRLVSHSKNPSSLDCVSGGPICSVARSVDLPMCIGGERECPNEI
jgi:hypothetical protein